MTAEQHEQLLHRLNALTGHVMLCGYDHPLYRATLPKDKWHFASYQARAGKAKPRTECIWTNYQPEESTLFD